VLAEACPRLDAGEVGVDLPPWVKGSTGVSAGLRSVADQPCRHAAVLPPFFLQFLTFSLFPQARDQV